MSNETLVWSGEWAVATDDGVVLTAGPDVRFELDGLDPATLETLRRWAAGGELPAIDDALTQGEERELRDLLLGLGAVTVCVPTPVTVTVNGSSPPGFLDALTNTGFELFSDAEVELVLRTSTRWPTPSARIHLGVDLTHHHTLVLGPLVIPGLTSCLACFRQQVARRWGDDVVPTRPAISRWTTITAELIAIQLEQLQRGATPLINATMAWDLSRGTVDRQDLLRAPDCGGPCRAPAATSIHLPWLER